MLRSAWAIACELVRLRGRLILPLGLGNVALIRNCLAAIEQEWTAHLGAQRFKALRETLQDLSLWLGKLT
jgi:hypothetical protein